MYPLRTGWVSLSVPESHLWTELRPWGRILCIYAALLQPPPPRQYPPPMPPHLPIWLRRHVAGRPHTWPTSTFYYFYKLEHQQILIRTLESQVIRKSRALGGPFGREQLHIDRVDVLRRKRILFYWLRCQAFIHLVLVKESRYASVFDYGWLENILRAAVESVDDLILQGSCR